MQITGLDPPASVEPWALANWIEDTLVLNREPTWSRTAIRETFPSGAEPDQAELDDALSEIERRATAAPSIYPFRVDLQSGVIQRAADVDPRVYEFLVLVSFAAAPFRKRSQFGAVNRLFDLL